MNKLSEKMVEIKILIKEKSPFFEKETERISRKFFNQVPNSVKILIDQYDFDKKKVLDIGCMFGQTLFYWGEQSEGIDIYQPALNFLKNLGRKVTDFNVEDGFDRLKGEQYQAVFSNNLIEHLVAPHLFLARLHVPLKPGGILAIGIPVVPGLFSWLWKICGIKGWIAKEHINFFTIKTMKLTLERAGFEVLGRWSPGLYKYSHYLSRIGVGLMPHCLFVCRKIENFKYDTKRGSSSSPSWAGDLDKFNQT